LRFTRRGDREAMAMNISVELMSGKVYPMEVQPTMTIRELKEEMKVGFW